MEAFLYMFDGSSIYAGVVNDGDAFALPPGYMFTDLTSHAGVCGIKLVYAHRGLAASLQSFYDQRSLYCSDGDDAILKALLQDIDFYFKGALACRRPKHGSHLSATVANSCGSPQFAFVGCCCRLVIGGGGVAEGLLVADCLIVAADGCWWMLAVWRSRL